LYNRSRASPGRRCEMWSLLFVLIRHVGVTSKQKPTPKNKEVPFHCQCWCPQRCEIMYRCWRLLPPAPHRERASERASERERERECARASERASKRERVSVCERERPNSYQSPPTIKNRGRLRGKVNHLAGFLINDARYVRVSSYHSQFLRRIGRINKALYVKL